MKAISNRVLIFALALCALAVIASSQLAQMHGQDKVDRPEGVGELPTRDDSMPPILYGNQTPFGLLPETEPAAPEPKPKSTSDQTQTVRRPAMPSSQSQGELPERGTGEQESLEQIDPEPVAKSVLPTAPQSVSRPTAGSAALLPTRPLGTMPAPAVRSAPVAALDLAPTGACEICGVKECTICCQPKCITKTILIPQYHTVWSSIFETRYRTEIKEESYTVEEEVQHQVLRVIQETVMVAEPRIRTYQDFREEEYQVPEDEPYSVMVRKPVQRMIPVEREETYRYPVEQEYTVMEEQEKIVTETKYKTIIDKEPRQKKYTVEVERKKKRVVVDNVEGEVEITTREPREFVKEIQRTRPEWRYRTETVTEIVKEPYVEYYEKAKPWRELKAEIVERTRNELYPDLRYVTKTSDPFPQTEFEQRVSKKSIPQNYTVAVPGVRKAYETYTVSVPREEEIEIPIKTRKQVAREVTRNYSVKIPYVEHIPRQYRIKVPMTVMKKGERFIPKQIPKTKYQTIKRDMGKWVTTVETIPTYEIESDRCGCSTCCPKTRTVRKTVWQPRIVSSRKPYTVFETVKQKVPYEYPVLEHRYETRSRLEPVTRYRTEQRSATFTVYDVKPAIETKTVTVRKFDQVQRQREINVPTFNVEQRTKMVQVDEYETVEVPNNFTVKAEWPEVVNKNVVEKFTELTGRDIQGPLQETNVVYSRINYRDKEVKLVKRVPERVDVPYIEKVTVTEYRPVTKVLKVQEPKPRVEWYTEKVPEIRTRIEYVDVEKRVPYVVEKTVKEMVPVKKTRTVYKTDVRTVTELKPEIYFETVEETFTRKVYKKKIRNVPVNRAEIYWVKVPKVLKKNESLR